MRRCSALSVAPGGLVEAGQLLAVEGQFLGPDRAELEHQLVMDRDVAEDLGEVVPGGPAELDQRRLELGLASGSGGRSDGSRAPGRRGSAVAGAPNRRFSPMVALAR